MSQLSLLLCSSNRQRLYFIPLSALPPAISTLLSSHSTRCFWKSCYWSLFTWTGWKRCVFVSLARGTFLIIDKTGRSFVSSHQSLSFSPQPHSCDTYLLVGYVCIVMNVCCRDRRVILLLCCSCTCNISHISLLTCPPPLTYPSSITQGSPSVLVLYNISCHFADCCLTYVSFLPQLCHDPPISIFYSIHCRWWNFVRLSAHIAKPFCVIHTWWSNREFYWLMNHKEREGIMNEFKCCETVIKMLLHSIKIKSVTSFKECPT
jgi:hypothetical protein